MRKLLAATLVAGAALITGPAMAADLELPVWEAEAPPVDYGLQGAFYIRGSAAWNTLRGDKARAWECVPCNGTLTEIDFPITSDGYGYSVGAGFGYETGTGLRFDATVDYLDNSDLGVTKGAQYGNRQGDYKLNLRSTIALANAYYDFSFGNSGYGYSAAGGAFAYVGAGIGAAFNKVDISRPAGVNVPGGDNTSLAAAGMVGVGYDFGSFTADIGYRGIYIAELTNGANKPDTITSEDNWLHEIRSTIRYRFN